MDGVARDRTAAARADTGSRDPDAARSASPTEPWLSRLWCGLRRRLWVEDTEVAARRRCRACLGMPFAGIAGVAWGVFAGPSLVGGAPFWAVVGAASFTLFMYVQQRLIAPVGSIVNRRWPWAGGFAGLAWETLAVGALFFAATRGLGAPLVPAVGTALGLGAAYVMVIEYLLCGSAGSDLSMLLQGAAAGSGARPGDDFSYAESLARRGRVSEAVELYRAAILRDGRRLTPYLRLSALWMNRRQPERAVVVLREAVEQADLDEGEHAFVARRIYETCAARLGDPSLARSDLERLVAARPKSEHATWARWRLRELRDPAERP